MLRVEDLCVSFHGRGSSSQVVHNLSFHMDRGEIIGLVGESGSGKTVTALAIAGLLKRRDITASGKIFLDDVELLSADREALRKYQGKDIAMVFQDPQTSLNPLMTVGKQVEESLRLHTEISKSARRRAAIGAMGEAELPEPSALYGRYPHQLSGGQQQRVMIAAAIIMRPKLLIADEPTTALDVTVQAQIIKLLLKLRRDLNMGILFVSPDLGVIKRLCSRVIVMESGHIVEEGTIDRVFGAPQKAYTQRLIASIPLRRKADG